MSEKTIKCLSIREPWAWLIVHGPKDVENRDWVSHYRGPLLIHASKTLERETLKDFNEEHPEYGLPDKNGFYLGHIVGIVQLIDCLPQDNRRSAWHEEHSFGFYLASRRPLKIPPVPYKGRLRLFNVPVSVLTAPRGEKAKE